MFNNVSLFHRRYILRLFCFVSFYQLIMFNVPYSCFAYYFCIIIIYISCYRSSSCSIAALFILLVFNIESFNEFYFLLFGLNFLTFWRKVRYPTVFNVWHSACHEKIDSIFWYFFPSETEDRDNKDRDRDRDRKDQIKQNTTSSFHI